MLFIQFFGGSFSKFFDLSITLLAFVYIKMYALPTVSAAAVAQVAGSPQSLQPQAVVKNERDKIEPRFAWMLDGAGVSTETMDKFGKLGLLTLQLFRFIAKDEDKLREFLKKDPILLDHEGDAMAALEVARIVGVFESSKETIAVENHHKAQRLHQDLPPKANPGEVEGLTKLFVTTKFKLAPIMIPSEAYYERKTHELETRFKAEPLSRVTNSKQEDVNDSRNMSWDNVNGSFKEKGKIFAVPMPINAEALRSRLRTMGVCWHYLHMKFPSRSELRTAEVEVFDRYWDWLSGPEVWGLATEKNGKPEATPALDHVLSYDLCVRKRVAELMNEGKDLKAAFTEVTNDQKLMQTQFLNIVQVEIGSAKCRACSAPGISEAHAALAVEMHTPQARAIEDGRSDGLSKSQLDKIRKQAKKEALDAAKRQLAGVGVAAHVAGTAKPAGQGTSKNAVKKRKSKAVAAVADVRRPLPLQNGGVGDGAVKGKGKGKGNGACYAWNDGKPCTNPVACPFKHICSKCGGTHKRPDCDQA